jgi:RNA polymerase sigma-70 factor (ECF subfamily)
MSDFAAIYEQERRRVFAYLLARSGNWHVAEDLTNDVFLVAWEKHDQWRDVGTPYAHYLLRIARLLFILHWKKEHRRRTGSFFERESDPALIDDGGIDALLDRCDTAIAYALLEAALPKLRTRPRRALVLRYGLGLQKREAARRMGISYEAYHALCRGAEERLRQIILGKEPTWTKKNARRRSTGDSSHVPAAAQSV